MNKLDEMYAQGLQAYRLGDLVKAQGLLQKVLKRAPSHVGCLNILAMVFIGLERFAEAQGLLTRALKLDRKSAASFQNLGVVLLKLKRESEAIAQFEMALQLDKNSVEARVNKAIALKKFRSFSEALKCLDEALARSPAHLSAVYHRADCLLQLGQLNEADIGFSSLQHHPLFTALALGGRARTLQARGRYEEALKFYDQALSIDSALPEIHSSRGNTLADLQRYEDAVSAFKRAIELDPTSSIFYSNMGNALSDLRRSDDAIAAYRQALMLDPENADAHFNLAVVELRLGQYKSGWVNYDWRTRKNDPVGVEPFVGKRLCRIDDCRGQTVLVYGEQGLGDTLQFCRYVPLLRQAGARVLFAPQPQLLMLMKSLGSDIELVNLDIARPDFDFQIPLLSLPRLFDTRLETIPALCPYLHAEDGHLDLWNSRIGRHGFKIGICWKGSSSFKRDRFRSFPVKFFAGLGRIPGIRLINLHRGDGEVELQSIFDFQVETLGPEFDSGPAFMDSAAVIANLDLVITSDTSIAHLAGALGAKVWVALGFLPDWRWLIDRPDSPWYPSMRLFRQTKEGDWKTVFDDIEGSLRAKLGGNPLS